MDIPKIDKYLKILVDDEVKVFIVKIFGECFKYTQLCQEQNIRNVESLHIFLTRLDQMEKYAKMMQSNSSYNYVHHYNTEILNRFDP